MRGYSLVETIVAIFVFAVGGLALASTSAVIGRELSANAVRERAARVATNRIEVLSAQCEDALAGSESVAGIQSSWSVSHPTPTSIAIDEWVSFAGKDGRRTEHYVARLRC